MRLTRAGKRLTLILTLLSVSIVSARSTEKSPSSGGQDAMPGGELRILGDNNQDLGACPLKNTDVSADITGYVGRVRVRQTFHNPLQKKIEAIYVFPLPQNAAVDDMTMTVGTRRIKGEIKRREEARAIYEAARERGNVASLLDQERPNIFTQSVANIEPGVQVVIEIGYVETLKFQDGVFEWAFPTVVGPRYMPGTPTGQSGSGWSPDTTQVPDGSRISPPVAPPVNTGSNVSKTSASPQKPALIEISFKEVPIVELLTMVARQADIVIAMNGNVKGNLAQINFKDKTPEEAIRIIVEAAGLVWRKLDDRTYLVGKNAADIEITHVYTPGLTPAVPMSPSVRAGHDINLSLKLDAGMPLLDISSTLHAVDIKRNGAQRATVTLKNQKEIPNKDFILRYRTATEKITDAYLHTSDGGGAYFTLVLQPPQRVTRAQAVPRELVFVLDTSGSMRGFPIEKAKSVMAKAIDSMGDKDTFNLITFSGATSILWDKPRPNTPENREAAQAFLASRAGSGGTEMMKAINAALEGQAEGKVRIVSFMTDGYVGNDAAIIDAVKKNSGTARVFSFGIGNSVNRFLLDGMAYAGRGEVEYVTLQSQADAAAQRFYERINAPVLTDIAIDWGKLPVEDVYPKQIPDLFSSKPIMIHGRLRDAADGAITLRGNTVAGPFERKIRISPAKQEEHEALASVWARAKVQDLMVQSFSAPSEATKQQVTQLGLDYRLMTPFTSFVAVEEMMVTAAGQPMKITVPVEMPDGVSYEGVFGRAMGNGRAMFGIAALNGMVSLSGFAGTTTTTTAGGGGFGGGIVGAPAARAPGTPGISAGVGFDKRTAIQGHAVGQPAPAGAQGSAVPPVATLPPVATVTTGIGGIGGVVATLAQNGLLVDSTQTTVDRLSPIPSKLTEPLRALAAKVDKEGKDGDLTIGKLRVVKYKVDVMIYLRDTSDKTLEALKQLGFVQTGESKAIQLLIGALDVRKLEELAKLDAVIRVTPVM